MALTGPAITSVDGVSRNALRRWPWSAWSFHLLLAGVAIAAPLAMVLASLLQTPGEGWVQTPAATIREYLTNSLILLLGTALVTTATGVSTAWLVTSCDFPGRRLFSWLLVVPLALPAYVVAFGYGDLLDLLIPLIVWMRQNWGLETARIAHDVLRYTAVVAVLSSVLYPYVYLAARSAFVTRSRTTLEAARLLGSSPLGAFFRVTLPLAWPSIAGGVVLVGMEVMNDYGAVAHFGIPTLTVGIFRFWFSFGDPDSASRIAAFALAVTFVLLGLERLLRGRRRFHESGGNLAGPVTRYPLRGKKAFAALSICALPVFIGCVAPIARLLWWSWLVGANAWEWEFIVQITHTVLLAVGATIIIAGLALTLAYAERLHAQRAVRWVCRIAILGYAIPSAVFALGTLRSLSWLEKGVTVATANPNPGIVGWLLGGSTVVLLFAYVARFLAVSFLPTQAGLKHVCGDLDSSARCLGAGPARTLWRVNLPLLKPTLWCAAILVFVDVLKELPLTLLLRPFNLETLATRAFNLVDQGRVQEAAPACLLIIGTGLVGVIALNRLLERGNR